MMRRTAAASLQFSSFSRDAAMTNPSWNPPDSRRAHAIRHLGTEYAPSRARSCATGKRLLLREYARRNLCGKTKKARMTKRSNAKCNRRDKNHACCMFDFWMRTIRPAVLPRNSRCPKTFYSLTRENDPGLDGRMHADPIMSCSARWKRSSLPVRLPVPSASIDASSHMHATEGSLRIPASPQLFYQSKFFFMIS